MAGGGAADNPNLKGLSRIFNAETNFGRANVRFHTFYSNYSLISVLIYRNFQFSFSFRLVRKSHIRFDWPVCRLQIAETKAKASGIVDTTLS